MVINFITLVWQGIYIKVYGYSFKRAPLATKTKLFLPNITRTRDVLFSFILNLNDNDKNLEVKKNTYFLPRTKCVWAVSSCNDFEECKKK